MSYTKHNLPASACRLPDDVYTPHIFAGSDKSYRIRQQDINELSKDI